MILEIIITDKQHNFVGTIDIEVNTDFEEIDFTKILTEVIKDKTPLIIRGKDKCITFGYDVINSCTLIFKEKTL